MGLDDPAQRHTKKRGSMSTKSTRKPPGKGKKSTGSTSSKPKSKRKQATPPPPTGGKDDVLAGHDPETGEPIWEGSPDVAETRDCPKCDATNPASNSWCDNCGYDFPFDVAGQGFDEQPAEGAGDEQPAEGAGDEQPAEGAGDEQPAEGAGDEQPAEGAAYTDDDDLMLPSNFVVMDHRERFETLPVRLMDYEVQARAKEHAMKNRELRAMKAQHKIEAQQRKALENELENRVNELADIVDEGREYREVPVVVVADIHTAMQRTYRRDTREFVPGKDRPLQPNELEKARQREYQKRQHRLPGIG
jgi:glutaredoxin